MSVAPADAVRLLQDARAAVAAGVVQGGDRAVVAAEQEDRVGPDLVGAVVAPFGDLGRGGEEQPVPGEDELQLRLIERLVGKEGTGECIPRAARREQCRDVFAQVHRLSLAVSSELTASTSPRGDGSLEKY